MARQQEIDRLRARLARVGGPARGRILAELGLQLAMEYWRAGPGQPGGVPALQEALACYEEAYGWFPPASMLHGQMAGMWGWLLGNRYLAHRGATGDRERGISLLGETLTYPRLPHVSLLTTRLVLGQLLMARVYPAGGDALSTGLSIPLAPLRGGGEHLRRAAGLFREVIEDPAAGGDLVALAKPLLALAETFSRGFPDVRKVVEAAAALRVAQQRAGLRGGLFGGAQELARMAPLDRPVVVMEGPIPDLPVHDGPPEPPESGLREEGSVRQYPVKADHRRGAPMSSPDQTVDDHHAVEGEPPVAEPPVAEPSADEPPAAEPAPEEAFVAVLREVRAELAAGNARAAARERVIDRLHEENQQLRAGERQNLLRPVVTDLYRLRDDLLRQAAELPADFGPARGAALLVSYAQTAELALERAGVFTVRPEAGDPFDARLHRAQGVVPAAVPEADATVAEVLRDGYRDAATDRVLSPASVVVARWAEPASHD